MSALWLCLLLASASGPAGEPPVSPEAPRALRPATEAERREAVDFAQLALGDWLAARQELRRELESLRRRGGSAGLEKLERWRAADLEAEVRRIQDGLNAARARLRPHGRGGAD
jgi:hypothetical protein